MRADLKKNKMNVVIILFACVAAATAQCCANNPFLAFVRQPSRQPQQQQFQRPQQQQFRRPQQQQFQQQQFQRPQQQQFQRPQQKQLPQQPVRQQPVQQQQQQSVIDGQVDDTFNGGEYHYSWRHDGGQKYTGQQAAGYCQRLGGSWRAISIETQNENNFVTRVIERERLDYVWTGGTRSGSSWRWPSNAGFSGLGWSHTGGFGRPQPDNRERGGENCLGILNNVYRDGVKWHDVACHHRKRVICEKL